MEETGNDSETGDEEVAEDDNETPVIEEETPAVEDEVISDEETSEETPEETPADTNKVTSVTPNALIPSELKVTAVEPDKSEGAAAGATKALESAEIVYTNGCVSADGKLRKGAPITFKLLPKAGKKLDTVQYKTKGTAAEAVETTGPNLEATNDTYTIPTTALMHKAEGSDELVNDVNVTIVVSTADIKYTVKPSTTGYKLFELKTEDSKTVADSTKEITAKDIAYADKDKEISFAVVKDEGVETKIRSVSVKAGTNGTEKVITSAKVTDDTAENQIYTFKPSELAGIAENDDQEIIITVEATAAAPVTIVKKVGEGAKLEAVTDAGEVYGETTAYADVSADNASATEGQKAIFAVKMDSAYKDLAEGDVTATLGDEPIEVKAVAAQTKGEGSDAKQIPAHYMIDLAAVTKPATLTITVKTDLKDDANTVTFESVSENSIITKTSSSDVLNGETIKVKGDEDYSFDVKAKPGYKIYAISAAFTKKYKAADGETAPADKAVTIGLKEDVLKAGADGAAVGVESLNGVQVAFSGTDTDGDNAGKAWTTTAITVKVNAKMDELPKEGITVIFDNPEYDYDVTTGANVVAGDSDGVYEVKPGAELFEFTVDAVAKPVLEIPDAEGNPKDILLGDATQTEDGWVYQIAAGALTDKQQISITRDTFDIDVDYDHSNITAEVYDPSDLEDALPADDTSDNTDTYEDLDADYAYRFIIEAKNDNTKISKVSYTVGDGEATEVNSRGGVYVFSVNLSNDVKVTVETKNEYDLVVKENGNVVTPVKNVYNVGHASTVTAELLNGQTKMALFNAEVKDGRAVAATIAKIDPATNVVTLEFDSSEYNKELTVELTLDDKKTKQSFKVKTTAAAAEVSLTGVKNGKVDIPVDTSAPYKLTVKTKNATLDGIEPMVIPADDTKATNADEIKKAQDAVSAEIDKKNGNLVITAAPAKEGTENAAKVILVDTNSLTTEQLKTPTVDNALKGGVVTVNTKDATIVGKNPTVTLVSTTDKDIKVQITTPKEVVNPEAGAIYYKVEVAAPETLPETLPAAVKTAITTAVAAWNATPYKAKADIDEDNGLLNIPIIINEDVKGVKLSGFSVTVTLIQTLDKELASASNAEKSITGGTATLSNIETKDPYYEVKLGLKKGTTTLITGQDKPVVIATPNFNKLTSYSYVEVTFVDTSTGRVLGKNYSGLNASYDTLQNAVIVNAGGASYTQYYNYKNLGVKVTAFAENSAYGAVATQKITVVNGIQKITASAPLEVYKADNKAATLTVTTNLNGSNSNKNYAPKTKKLDYEIVAAKNSDKLPENIKANVTVKNGKVTIAKGYIPAPKATDNTFRVRVSAADYADNPCEGYTKDITITDQGLQMGEIAVFAGYGIKDDYSSLKGAGTASIEAEMMYGEYHVQVLNPGVKTNKKAYTESDYVDPSLLTFKSSNAKSVDVDEEGNLTIYKAAKNVKITAVPKDGSNPKPVKTLTLTVGQVNAAPLLRISRYRGSVADDSQVDMLHEGGTTTINYNGNSTNNYFKLEVVKAVTNGDDTSYKNFYLANYQITYKGAKQLRKDTNYNGDTIKIVANAEDAVITLKNKADSKATPIVYTLKNVDFVKDNKAKAPKFTTKAKLTQYTDRYDVVYSVTGGKEDDFTDNYVILSADQTKKNPSNIGSVLPDLDKALPIILGERLNLKVDTTYAGVGNYNLVATVGSLKDGVFKPLYKDAKVVVKIAKQGNTNLSVTGNYTLSLKAGDSAAIKYKSGNGRMYATGDVAGNYAKNAIINGQENHFRDYFEVYYDDQLDLANGHIPTYEWKIALKKDLPLTAPANDAAAPALDKIASNDYKNDRIGYISVNNGGKFIDVKLTVTIKDHTTDKTKYKVTATPVLDGPKAVTALTILEGKTPVDVRGMMAVSSVGFKPVYSRYGDCYLEADNLPAGNHKVDLYIIPWSAPKAYRDALAAANTDEKKQEVYETYGVKASITVKAAPKATTKNKVVLVNKNSNKWDVADTDYNYAGWSKDTPFSFKNGLSVAANTNINIKATVDGKDVQYVTFNLDDPKYMSYETITENGQSQNCIVLPTSYPMVISLDKAKLVAAIAADATDSTVANNKKLDWGKTVKVKATFSYGADVPVADELTFDIKLPANAGASDDAVKTALEGAEKRLQSNIETKYNDLLVEYNDDLNSLYQGNVTWAKGEVNSLMMTYVTNEVKKLIQNASVTVVITDSNSIKTTLEDGEEEGETPTPTPSVNLATSWTVDVKSTAGNKDGLYNHDFVIPGKSTISGVETAINNLNFNEIKVTAATTAEEYALAVRKNLGTAAGRNISITAEIADSKVPTLEEDGYIIFTLTAKDLSMSPKENGYSKVVDASRKFTLLKLDSLATCISNVTTGLDADALTPIVRDAYKEIKAKGSALDEKVKELILAKANELITNNPNVSVDKFAKKADPATEDDFTFDAPESADDNGTIEFTLHFVDKDTAETADNAATFTRKVSTVTLNKIDEFQSPAELLEEAKKITEIDYVDGDQDAALAAIRAKILDKSINLNPGYNASDLKVEATTGETETTANTEYTKAGAEDGKITNVKVTTATDVTYTIASVKIKKSTTAATPETPAE